jgi:hypothetical protein
MLGKTHRSFTRFVCLSLAAIVLFVDFITGLHIRFPLVFVLPVGLAAWKEDKILSYVLAILLPLVRFSFHFIWQDPEALSSVIINMTVSVLVLFFYAYLLNLVVRQRNALKRRTKMLEGILPICASCKKIRNEKGEYERIEKYVSEHSEASFSHTICPECGKKLYPFYYENDGHL